MKQGQVTISAAFRDSDFRIFPGSLSTDRYIFSGDALTVDVTLSHTYSPRITNFLLDLSAVTNAAVRILRLDVAPAALGARVNVSGDTLVRVEIPEVPVDTATQFAFSAFLTGAGLGQLSLGAPSAAFDTSGLPIITDPSFIVVSGTGAWHICSAARPCLL